MELTHRERILLTTEVLNKLTGKLIHDSKIFVPEIFDSMPRKHLNRLWFPWQVCLVNKSGLLMFDVCMSETKCLVQP